MSRSNNTMASFNINRLEEYYADCKSFKCGDIKQWCKDNIYNEDYDIAYAAKEIYTYYFNSSTRTLRDNNYYYIVPNKFSKYLYHLERDIVMSPLRSSYTPNRYAMKSLLESVESLEKKILNHTKCLKEDRDYIDQQTALSNKRIRRIIHRKMNLERYPKYTNFEKKAMYSILEDRYNNLVTRLFILTKIQD